MSILFFLLGRGTVSREIKIDKALQFVVLVVATDVVVMHVLIELALECVVMVDVSGNGGSSGVVVLSIHTVESVEVIVGPINCGMV